MIPKDRARKLRLKSMPGLSFTLIFQISLREFLITENKVVATNTRTKKPPLASYQGRASVLNPRVVCLICAALPLPNVSENISMNSDPTNFLLKNRLNN